MSLLIIRLLADEANVRFRAVTGAMAALRQDLAQGAGEGKGCGCWGESEESRSRRAGWSLCTRYLGLVRSPLMSGQMRFFGLGPSTELP